MIYKLYVNIAGWSQLDFDFDKKSIIDTMVCDNKIYKHTYYMIVGEDEKQPTEIEVLRNQEEIDNYIKVFNERQRLNNMPVMELKEYILNKNLK